MSNIDLVEVEYYVFVFDSKKGNVVNLKDFRPISLVGGLYKLLTMVFGMRIYHFRLSWLPQIRFLCIVLIAFLHEDLLYFEFSLLEEASRALEMESRRLRGGFLDLERWNPDLRCIKSIDRAKEAWIRVVGLPLHLWIGEILKLKRGGVWGFYCH